MFIYHPYSDSEFGKTVDRFFNFKKKFDSQKKLYLIQDLVNNKKIRDKIKTYFFIKRKKNIFLYLLQIIKLYIWGFVNNLNLINIRFTSSLKELNKETIFYANARNALKYDPVDFLKRTSCIKIFNLSHLEVETSLISNNAKKIGVDFFVFENNLTKNSKYFRHFFNYYKNDTLVLPHTYNKSFKNYKKFFDKKNLCFASGRVILFDKKIYTSYLDFMNYYKINYQHKIRYEIYQNQNKINGLINSFISLKDSSSISENKLSSKIALKYYSSFDIVDMYNNHKMFVAPEGINDTPPIGFVEGMSCGSALFALDDPMYSDIGLKNEFHYISYDGSLDDLLSKIKFYQKNNSKLEKIAINGHEFATNDLNPNKVSLSFIKTLIAL